MAARKPVKAKKPVKPVKKPVKKSRRRDDSVPERTYAPARFRLLNRPNSKPITGVKVTDSQGTKVLDKTYPAVKPKEWAEHLKPEMQAAVDQVLDVTVYFGSDQPLQKRHHVSMLGEVDIEVQVGPPTGLEICVGPWPVVGQDCLL